MKEITTSSGKKIYQAEDYLEMLAGERLYDFIKKSLFRIGWEDTTDSLRKYLFSSWNENDVTNSGFLSLLGDDVKGKIKDKKFNKCIVNLDVPGNVHYAHVHPNETVVLYYVNRTWLPEWAGETIFYSEDLKSAEYVSLYTPNRLIVFDGEIPHTIRPQSSAGPDYRFTLSVFFDGKLK